MKVAPLRWFACFGLGLFMMGGVADADTKYYYPDQENAVFSIVGPDDWELQQAESDDDWFHIAGPTGAVLSFRAVSNATEDKVAGLVTDWKAFLEGTYDTLKVGEPQDLDGDAGWFIQGSGRNKESGDPIGFSMSLVQLGPTDVAQIWFAVSPNDIKGEKSAIAILNTLTAEKKTKKKGSKR